jgi:type II secretory pathway component PulK
VVIRHRERGVALVFAMIALAVVALMVMVVAAGIQPRITSHEHLERTVRLTALVDAAMAATLAELAVDPGDTGVDERRLGEGVMSSTVTQVGEHEVEVVAVGRTRGWRAVVTARVNLEHGPRVLRWTKTQSPERSAGGSSAGHLPPAGSR